MRTLAPAGLVFVEASKVRHYHSTMVDGFVSALTSGDAGGQRDRPRLLAHASFFANLRAGTQAAVEFESIAVMDQDRRRLVRKALLEFWVVARAILGMRRDETMLVTTLMPPAMILLEIFAWFVPKRRVVVLQHGELEGAFEKHRQRIGSFGFYILLWLRLRRFGSRIEIAVLDGFIAKAVRQHVARSISDDALHVLPLPMTAVQEAGPRREGPLRCCFIGFDTHNKGMDIFKRLAEEVRDLEFRVIGGGVDRLLAEKTGRKIGGADEFLAAVGDCDVAILPYTGGYSCSLSAAATDGISAGLHLLTSDRACFVALQEAFGQNGVTVCADETAMTSALRDPAWRRMAASGRADRLQRVATSRYGAGHVAQALAEMLERPGEVAHRLGTDETTPQDGYGDGRETAAVGK